MTTEFRVGIGYDVHALEDGYDLIIGGVNIDFSKGSKGHSDGDALMHSIVAVSYTHLTLPTICSV